MCKLVTLPHHTKEQKEGVQNVMKDETTYLIKKLRLQVTVCCSLMVLTGIFTLLFYFNVFAKGSIPLEEITLEPVATEYDISLLDDSKENLAVKFGHELFINTPKYNGNPDRVY